MNFDCFSFLVQNSIALNIFVHTCVYFHEVDARRGVAELKDVYILNSGNVFQNPSKIPLDCQDAACRLSQPGHLLTCCM